MRFASTVVVSFAVTALTYVAMQLWIGPRLPVPSTDAPSLSGMTVQQARTAMDARGLRLLLDEERPKDGVTPGTICEQRPLPGSMVRRGDEIHVVIAKSGDATRVPRTAGMTPQAAREIVEAAKLRVGDVSQVADAATPAGLVIGTAPPAEANVALGATVTLRVSTGATLAAVPQLFGKRLSSAKELIEKSGFQLGAVKKGSNEDRDPGEIIAQTPKANEQAPAGSKIDVVVNSD
jgi:beta-lactam-binding protein with PASTA domain